MSDVNDIVWPASLPFDIRQHALFICQRGSESHNLYIPPEDADSICDRDVYAVVIPPLKYYFGLTQFEHAEEINDPWDVVIDEFRKFIFLLRKQNPTALSMLWLHESSYWFRNTQALNLFTYRNAFRSRDAANKAFTGYAFGQFKKMTEGSFNGYMGEKRKQLVRKHGYDVKNACHLIRLLKMGAEFHRTGKLTVFRTDDREELLAIKRGALTLPEVRTYAGELFKDCEKAYQESVLPEALDEERIEYVVRKIMLDWFGMGSTAMNAWRL